MNQTSLPLLQRAPCGRRIFFHVLGVMCALWLFMPRHAHADPADIWAKCDWVFQDVNHAAPNFQVIPGGLAAMGRDVQLNEPFGPWFGVTTPVAWRCTPVDRELNQPYRTSVEALSKATREGTIEYEGETYGTYQTANFSEQGLSYIVRWRYWIDGHALDWVPLTAVPRVYQTPATQDMVHANTTPYDVTIETQVKIVQTVKKPVRPGTKLYGFEALVLRVYQTDGQRNNGAGTGNRVSLVQNGAIVIGTGGTCTTPDVTVTLPDAPLSRLSDVGSVAARKNFDLVFRDCPTGLSNIEYSFAPTTSVLSAADGVVKLDNSSTAKGVGMQFLKGDSEPLKFDHDYVLGEYDSASGGDYKIPMTAGIYQTDPQVTAGTASSSITFTVKYK